MAALIQLQTRQKNPLQHIPRKVPMETTLTINIPAPSARARGTGVGGGEDGGGKEEKTNVCFKLYGFLHSSTTLHNRLIQVLKRSLLTKTSCMLFLWLDIFIQFLLLGSIKRGRNMIE